jgi:hypothetical protein
MTSDRIDLDTLRRGAQLAGFTWTDAELEDIRPQVESALRLLRALESPDLGGREPSVVYRTV